MSTRTPREMFPEEPAMLPPAPPPAAARSDSARSEEAGAARVRTRKRKNGSFSDRFDVPRHLWPVGMTYEWKRHTLLGAVDPAYEVEQAEQGWEAVPASRHRNFMPTGYSGAIIRDGLILMERPEELTKEAQDEDKRNAFMAVKVKEAQLSGTPVGSFDRLGIKVGKSYDTPIGESFEIPS